MSARFADVFLKIQIHQAAQRRKTFPSPHKRNLFKKFESDGSDSDAVEAIDANEHDFFKRKKNFAAPRLRERFKKKKVRERDFAKRREYRFPGKEKSVPARERLFL